MKSNGFWKHPRQAVAASRSQAPGRRGKENARAVPLSLLGGDSEGQQTDNAVVTSGVMPESLHGGMGELYSQNRYFQWDGFSSTVLRMITISGDPTCSHASVGSCLSGPAWRKYTCNYVYFLFSNERGRNIKCTQAALDAKRKDTLEIWGNNFERILFDNYVLVLEYTCIGMKPNKYSWSHRRNSTFNGPICLQICFHLCIVTMGRTNVFCKDLLTF